MQYFEFSTVYLCRMIKRPSRFSDLQGFGVLQPGEVCVGEVPSWMGVFGGLWGRECMGKIGPVGRQIL